MIPNDPVMLLSYTNTALRDHYSSLDEFCRSANISREVLEEKLKAIDYLYDENRNAFV